MCVLCVCLCCVCVCVRVNCVDRAVALVINICMCTNSIVIIVQYFCDLFLKQFQKRREQVYVSMEQAGVVSGSGR